MSLFRFESARFPLRLIMRGNLHNHKSVATQIAIGLDIRSIPQSQYLSCPVCFDGCARWCAADYLNINSQITLVCGLEFPRAIGWDIGKSL